MFDIITMIGYANTKKKKTKPWSLQVVFLVFPELSTFYSLF